MRRRPKRGSTEQDEANLVTSTSSDEDVESTSLGVAGDKTVLNACAGSLFLLQAVLVYYTFGDAGSMSRSVDIVQHYPSVSKDGTQVISESHVVFNIDVNKFVAFYFTIASLSHFCIISPFISPLYAKYLRQGCNPFRWIEYSLSASVMCIVMGISVGCREISVLVALCVAMATVQMFGYLAEGEFYREPEKGVPAGHWFGWVPFAFVWMVIFYQIRSGGEMSSEYGFPSIVIIFCLFCAFGLVQWLQFRLMLSPDAAEVTYVALSMVDKTFLGLCCLGGLFA